MMFSRKATLTVLGAIGGFIVTLLTLEASTEGSQRVTPVNIAQSETQFDYEDFQFWVDQCLLLGQEDDHQKTLEICERAIAIEPRELNLALWSARSIALFNLGEYVEVIASFNQILVVAPNDSLALAYQCAAYGQLERYDDAVDTCEQALRINGNWGDRSPGFAWYHRGLALLAMGRLETALESFSKAVDNQPENIIFQAHQCALEIELGIAFDLFVPLNDTKEPCYLRETIALYERALALQPENADLWLQQGLALEQLGDYERALISYTQALAIRPEHSFTLAHQCAVLNHLGDYEAALAACESALQGDGRWGRVGVVYGWTQTSHALIGMTKYEEAFAAAKRGIDLSPDVTDTERITPATQNTPNIQPYPPAWNNLAVSFWHLGNYQRAEWGIDMALQQYTANEAELESTFQRRYPESPIFFYRSLTLAHYNHGRIMASLIPEDESHQDYLYLLRATEAYTEALTIFRDAVLSYIVNIQQADKDLIATIHIQEAIAHGELARLSPTLGLRDRERLADKDIEVRSSEEHLTEARSAARLATANAPDSFAAQYTLGITLLELGEYEDSLQAFEAANQLQPDNVYVLTGSGLAWTGLGDAGSALPILERVVNLLPGYAPAETVRACIVEQTSTHSPEEEEDMTRDDSDTSNASEGISACLSF